MPSRIDRREPGELVGDLVFAGRNRRKAVRPFLVGHRRADALHRGAGDGDGHAGHHAAGGVRHLAVDRAGGRAHRLRVRRPPRDRDQPDYRRQDPQPPHGRSFRCRMIKRARPDRSGRGLWRSDRDGYTDPHANNQVVMAKTVHCRNSGCNRLLEVFCRRGLSRSERTKLWDRRQSPTVSKSNSGTDLRHRTYVGRRRLSARKVDGTDCDGGVAETCRILCRTSSANGGLLARARLPIWSRDP